MTDLPWAVVDTSPAAVVPVDPGTDSDAGAAAAGVGTDAVPELDELYDDATLSRIEGERWSAEGVGGRTRVHSRFGLSGAVLAGIMLGVAVVYDPEPDKPTVVEADADGEPFEGLPVQVRIDPGNPRGSEILLRRPAS